MAAWRQNSIGPGRPNPRAPENGWVSCRARAMIGDIEAVQGILGNRDMAKAYYSTVLERPARDVSADPVGAVGNGALSGAAQSTAAVGAIGRRTVANLRI